MKKSITWRVAATFMILMTACFLLIGLFQWFFLGDFYLAKKEKNLVGSWSQANALSSGQKGSDPFRQLDMYCAVHGLTYCIADGNLSVIRSNVQDSVSMVGRLFGNLLEKEEKNTRLIESGNHYKIIKIHDRFTSVDYLELWGVLDDGNYFLVSTSFQSISDSAEISMQFYMYIGLAATLVSLVIIWLVTKRIVNPVLELTALSKRMADLDFEVRYSSGGKDEIGVLGENFNIMSDKLQRAVGDLKSANAELKRDIKEKERIDERRREFLANVSHELKTPIALIQGYAEGLKDNVNDDAESRDFYCDVIMDESQKMNRLVKQLLSLNQLESGRDKIVMERFDLTELISGLLQSSRLLLEQKEACLYFGFDRPVYVWGDEFKIEEVVTNYLTNALNHLDGDRQIEITWKEDKGIITTTVFNSGQTIPEDELDLIWQKFYKVDKARTRAYGGSGVGLSIVKAIMDSHQQKCWATNYDNGVAFSFTLECKTCM